MGILLSIFPATLAAIPDLSTILDYSWGIVQIFIGFSAIIFVHELGHFLAARWAGVRVEKFCIGFGKEVVGFTRGETRYALNALPLGGYVKMLGQDDFDIDKTGEIVVRSDPRSFTNKSVFKRMVVVSGGVFMNVVFAALLFMVVFMIGKEMETNKVGLVVPGSPAEHGGLQSGDVIRYIDGERITDFGEVRAAITLAEPHKVLDFVVDRGGQMVPVPILPENDKDRGLLTVGVAPAVTGKIIHVDESVIPPGVNGPKTGDVIVSVDGVEVTDANANDVIWSVLNRPGKDRKVIVDREEKPGDPSTKRRVEIVVEPEFMLASENPLDPGSAHLLGLVPLVRVADVVKDSRAEKAGLRAHDIILQFGDVSFPTRDEVLKHIAQNPEIDIPVKVRRIEGTEEELEVRPAAPSGWSKSDKRPMVGLQLDEAADTYLATGRPQKMMSGQPSPAMLSGIPAGAVIKRVQDQPVGSWQDLVDAFQTHAGSTVKLAFTKDGQDGAVDFPVPHCLQTRLGLSNEARILELNGKSHVEVELNNRRRPFDINFPFALREALRNEIGNEVDVTYVEGRFGEKKSARLTITEDMFDPWLGRINYVLPFATATQSFPVRTSNPIEAMKIGIKKTLYFLRQVYVSIQRMVFSRSVGVENISGPVGILKIGADTAQQGVPELLFLLALLSANLAVINFLPLPVMDGGLMVFLIIEALKGSPVGIKTQVVTQVIGLALIFVAFVFVTFQDLLRISSGTL